MKNFLKKLNVEIVLGIIFLTFAILSNDMTLEFVLNFTLALMFIAFGKVMFLLYNISDKIKELEIKIDKLRGV